MPANWTTPITWNVDQLVTNTDLNQQLRDNLDYLLSPNHQRIVRDNGSSYSITSVTTFQDIDSVNLSISLVTHGGPVWVSLLGRANISPGTISHFDVTVDGVRVGAAYTLGLTGFAVGAVAAGVSIPVNVSLLLTGLNAGTHVLRPQWRTGGGDTTSLSADATTHPLIFEAIEL